MAKFNNTSIITTGRKLTSQQPIVDKRNYKDVSDVLAAITAGDVGSWYASMDMYLDSANTDYVWLDVNLLPGTVDISTKLLPTDHNYGVHPDDTENGILYYNRSFNFYRKVTAASIGTGDVVGPSSAIDGNLATFDTNTGKLIQDSLSKVSDFATSAQGSRADAAVQTVNGNSGTAIILDKSDLGLGNVDNVADVNKPVSSVQQVALNLKADLNGATIINASVNGVTLEIGGPTTEYLSKNGTYTTPAGGGDVTGPVVAVDENIAVFDSTTGKVLKDINLKSTDFAPALGVNDNYVTDAEKIVIGNTSGTNTGDQDLSGLQDKHLTIRTITGTTDTLVLADDSKYLRCTNVADITVTIPTNASVAFPIGTVITFRQAGAGQIILSGAGTTLNGNLKSAEQHASLQIAKVATDTWDVTGGVA